MKKIALFSMFSAAAFGIIKILSVIPFNRMADDDFAYANMVTTNGFWKAQWIWYTTWTGKFASTFFQSLAQFTVGHTGKVILLPIITIVLLFLSLAIFFSRFLKFKITNYYVLLISGLILVSLYLITPNKAESWHWLTASVIYLWPLIFLLIGVSTVFLGKLRKIDYLISFILVFIASAGNEEIGLLINIALFFALISFFIKKKPIKLLITMLSASAISYAIVFFAPGNALRGAGAASDQMNWFGSFVYSVQTGPFHLFSLISKNLFFLLSSTLVLSYFFSTLIQNVTRESFDELLNKIFVSLMIPIGLSIFYLFPAYRVLGRLPPDRSDITLAFVIIMSVIAISYYLGLLYNFTRFNKTLLFTIFITLSSFLLIISSFKFTSSIGGDIYIAKNYSDAYDQMIIKLQNESGAKNKKQVEVSKLPESGLIPPLQIQYGWIRDAVSVYYQVPGIINK